jgi:hypothetical protein
MASTSQPYPPITRNSWSSTSRLRSGQTGFLNPGPYPGLLGRATGQYVYYSSFSKNPGYRRVKVGQTHPEVFVDVKDLHEFGSSCSGLTPGGAALFVRDVSTDQIYSLDVELP